MKDIYYIHDTPLAGLAAHMHVGLADKERAALLEKLPFLDLPEHLVQAGADREGRTVYGIWMREADPELIRRLVEGFLSVSNIPPDSYEVRIVRNQGRLAVVALLFKFGFYRAARRLLAGWRQLLMRQLVSVPGID